MRTPLKSPLPLFFLLTACAPSDGGQVGEETILCQAVVSEDLGPDDLNPLGFVVSEVLALAEGSHQSPLVWADGSSTILQVGFSYLDSATYQDREWTDDGSGGGIEPAIEPTGCEDILSLQMAVTLSTDDGALSESYTVDLQAAQSSEAAFTTSLDAIMGTLAVESFAPDENFDSYSAFLDLVLDAQGVRGSIVGQAVSENGGGGDDGTVSATSFDIASFGNNE